MGFINRKKTEQTTANAHLNWMGGASYDVHDPLLRLRLAAASCFFGEPMYYQRDSTDKRPARARPTRDCADSYPKARQENLKQP
jgi:hypothetical protein